MPYKDPAVRRSKQVGYQRRYLEDPAHKTAHLQRIVRRREKIRDWLREVKASLECVRCGEQRPQTLDFHHLDPSSKDFSLGDAIRRGYARARILDEIARCEVLCANCHRMEHADW